MYPEMTELPLAGEDQETVMLVPATFALGAEGADGAATVTALDANDRAEEPTALVASTLTE